MPLHMEGQMIRPGEGPLAEATLEGPVPGVLPVMAGQLIGTRELPPASLPPTLIRLFTRVRA